MKLRSQNVSENITGILVKLGLTATQAKIYASLVTLGKTNATSLTKFSKISRQDVYQTLNELFDMSLIEKKVTKPIEYQAVSPKMCLEILTTRRNRITNETNHAAEKIFAQFKTIPEESNREASQLLLVPRKEPVLFRAHDMIDYAQETIRVITPSQKMSPWIIDETNFFLNALKRNVTLQLITDFPTNLNSWQKALAPFENEPLFMVKYISSPPSISFGIYDRKKIILELLASGTYLDSEVVITENSSVIEMASTYFELTWNQAAIKKLSRVESAANM
jgi:sugar-specific transcriptional regulator TrmB